MAKDVKSRAPRRRSVARLAAVQALYELEMAGAQTDTVLRRFLEDRWTGKEPGESWNPGALDLDRELLTQVVHGVSARLGDLDRLIDDALSKKWTMERLETVLKAILRAGAFELSALKEVPPRVVITEYVDVAHAFFAANEPALVNGVLDRLAHVLRADEMKASEGEQTANTE